MAKITETGSNETLTPVNASNDKITLESGDNNDTIVVTGNNDTIIVQANDTGDTVTVTGMNETVSVGNGNNTINIVGTTASGRNSVTVGNGNDTISISGTTHNNTIHAGNGNDKITVSGTSHNNTITAGTGVDVINITATSTNDFINVGGTTGWFFWKNQGPDPVGADTITVNANVTNDSIFVGNGNATISIAGTSHNDTIIAGDGMDSLTISGTSTNDLINLGSNHTWDGLSGFWSNYEFDREYWTNGAAADGDTVLITGATSKDVISVGNGTNFVTITGASKFDYVYTGNGQNVILISNDASDVIWAGNGGNYISTAGTGDIVHSGSGNDTIVYNAADVLLDGGGGFNTLLVNAHQAAPINLTLSNSPVENFQFIDLTGSGGKANFAGFDTTLDLNVATVNALAGSVVNPFDGKAHTLVDLAGADDVVNMGTGWTNVTPTNEPTLTANELLINGSDAQVLTPVTLTNYQVYTETYHNVTNTLIVDKAGVGVLSFSQSPLNVGIVTLGNLTAPDPETITNTGTAPLTISGISSLSGTEFIIENDTVPDTLKPGQSETFYLKLIGNVAGLATASLTITDNGSTPTQTLTLTGNVHFQTVTEPAFILTTTGSTGPTTLSEGAGSLTANDSAGIGIPIGAALHTGPSHGTVIVNADGSFTYTDTGTTAITYYTPDSFTYTITDSLGFSAPITATIDVADHYTPVIASLGSFTPSSSTFAFSIPEITAESYQVGVGSTVTPETYTYSLSAVAGTNSAALINHGISVNASGIITLSNTITFAQTDDGVIDVSLNVQDFNSHLSATDEVEITLNTPDLFTTGNDNVTFYGTYGQSSAMASNANYTEAALSFFLSSTILNTLGGSDSVSFDSGATGYTLTIPATPANPGTDAITFDSAATGNTINIDSSGASSITNITDNEGGNTINLGSNSTAVDSDSVTLTVTASSSLSPTPGGDTIYVYGDYTNPNTISIDNGASLGVVNLSDTINIEDSQSTTTITDGVGGNTIQIEVGGASASAIVNLTDSGAADTVKIYTHGSTLNIGSSTNVSVSDYYGGSAIDLLSSDTVLLHNTTTSADTFVLPTSWASTDVVQGLFTPGTPTPGNPSENVLNLSSVTGITTADLNNPSLFSVDGSGDLLLTLPGGSIDFTDLTYQPGYILYSSGNNLADVQLYLDPYIFNYNTQYTTQQTLAPGNTSILDTITLENMPDTTLSTLGSVLSFTINGSDEYAFTLTNPNGSIGEFGNAVLTSPTPGSGAPSEPYETVTFDVEASGSMTPTAYQAFLFDGTSGSGNPNDANLLYGFNENNQTLAGDVNSSSAVSPTTNLTYQSNYISTATDTASEANTLVGNIFDSQNDGMDLSSPLSITFSSNTIIAVAGIDFLIGNIDSVGDGIYSTNGGTFTFGSNNLNAGGGVSDYLVGNIYTGNYGINTTNGIFTFDSNNLSAGGGSFDLLVGNIDTANDGLITTGFNTTFTFDQNMLTVTGTGSGNILVGNIDALIGTSSYTGTFTFDSNTLTVNGAQNGDTLVGNSYTSSTVSDSDPIGISYFSSTYTFDSNTLTVNGTASGDTLVGNIYASTSASDSYPLGLNGFGLCTFASNVLTVNGNDDTLVGNVYASSSASDLNPVGIVASFGPFTFASNQLTANGNDDTLVGNVYASSAGGGSFPIGIESNNINFTVISTFASNTLTVDGSGSGDTLVGNIDADGGTAISAGSSTPSFTFAGNTLVAGSGSEMLTGHILGSVSGSPTLSFTSGDTFMFNANTPQGPGNTPIVDTITDFNVGNHFNSSNLVDTIEFYNIISQNLTTLESQVVVGSDANGGVELGVYDNSTDASNAQTLITNGILPTTGLDLIIDLEINNNIGGGLEGGLNYVSGQNTLQYYISQGDLNVSVFNDYVFDEQNTSPEFVDHGNLDLTHGTISLINMSPDASATTVGEALNFSINNSGDYALTLITPDGFEFGNAVITTIVPGSGSPHDTVNFNVEIAGSTTPIADQAFLFDGTSGSGISGDSNPLYGFGTGDIIAGDLYQSDLTTSATYLSNYISTATDTMTDSNTLVGNIYDDNFNGGGIDLSIYQTISFASNILTAGAGSDFLTGNIYANNDGIDSTNGGLFTFYSNTLSAGGGSLDTQVGNIFGGNDGIDSTNGGSFTFYSNTLSAGGGSFDTQVGNIGAGNDGIDSTNGGSFTFYSNTLSAGCGENDTLVGNIYAPNDDGIDANGGSYSFGSNTLTVNGTGSGDTLVGNIVGGTDAINIIGGSPSFTFAGNTLVAGTGSETLTGHVTGVSGSGATFTFNGGDTFVFNLNLNPTTAVTDTITDFNVGYNYNSSNNPDMIILNGIGNASQVKFSNDGSNGIDVNVFSNPAHTQQIATIDLLYHSLGSVLQGGEAYASSAPTVSPMGNSLHIVIV